MQIESSALYTLYDNLIVPRSEVNKKPDSVIVVEGKPANETLFFFKNEPLPDENELLNKIIAAIGIDAGSIKKHVDLPLEIIEEFIKNSNGICILWGIDHPKTGKYKLAVNGESKLIVSDDLGLLKTDQTVKAKLWSCLKEAFGK